MGPQGYPSAPRSHYGPRGSPIPAGSRDPAWVRQEGELNDGTSLCCGGSLRSSPQLLDPARCGGSDPPLMPPALGKLGQLSTRL